MEGLWASNIALIEDNKIICNDLEVANILNTDFDEAVASLNTNVSKECTTDIADVNG